MTLAADKLNPTQRHAIVVLIRVMLAPGLSAAYENQVPGATTSTARSDELTARRDRAGEWSVPDDTVVAARTPTSRDIADHNASLGRGEKSQDSDDDGES